MKKCILLLLLTVSLFSVVNAQDKDRRNSFKFNAFNAFLGRLSLQYEHVRNKLHGLNLNGNISFADKLKGFLVGANYRYYFQKEKKNSMFFGTFINFSDYDKDYEETVTVGEGQQVQGKYTLLGKTFVVGANFGKRWNFLRIFNLTARVGYGYPMADLKWEEKTDAPNGESTPPGNGEFERKYKFNSGFDGEVSFGIRF